MQVACTTSPGSILNAVFFGINVVAQVVHHLGSDPTEAMSLARWIDEVEKKVDKKHLQIKGLMLKSEKEVAPSALIMLKDLVESMEQVADYCDDTADYVRVLAIVRKST